jgi:PPOX class probable F420-dependent enzyme
VSRIDPDLARLRFAAARVARLATVTAAGRPQLVPIVFVVSAETIFTAVDAKPKRTSQLQRLANVEARPAVSVLVDHYDDADWTALSWARADGQARVLARSDPSARAAIELLSAKYPQHAEQPPPGPVLAIEVERWSGWAAAPE